MVKVKWSKQSLEDLKELCNHIALDSPYYARIFNDKIFEMVEHLESFPEIGVRVKESKNKNVKQLIYKSYRIIYQIIESDLIEIINDINNNSKKIMN